MFDGKVTHGLHTKPLDFGDNLDHVTLVLGSDILVLKFILVLVFISFINNHFYCILLQFFKHSYFSF